MNADYINELLQRTVASDVRHCFVIEALTF